MSEAVTRIRPLRVISAYCDSDFQCRSFIQNEQIAGCCLSVPSTGESERVAPDSLTAVFYSLRSALIPEPQIMACYSVVRDGIHD